MRERFGYGSAYLVFHREEPVAAFKANTREGVIHITDFVGDSDLEKEAGIATRDYTKYHNDKSVDEIIKYDFNKATEFALNELGDDGWELISIEKIKPQGFDVMKFGANKMYNFKRIKE